MRRENVRVVGGATVVLGVLLAATGAWAQMAGGGAPTGMEPNRGSNTPGAQAPGGVHGPSMNASQGKGDFFANARRNIQVETDLSKMALKNSTNDDVKKFAQDVILENKKDAMVLMGELSNESPSGMPFAAPVPSQTRNVEKQMKKLKGKEFDEMYLVQMNGYVTNDKTLAADASSGDSSGELEPLTMRLRSTAEQREKQIAQVAESEGLKLP